MSRLIQTTFAELTSEVERQETLSVRLAAELSAGEWSLRLLELTSGETPPRWQEIDWHYPEFIVGAFRIGSGTVASWLAAGEISWSGVKIAIAFHDQVSRERRESGWSTNACEPLPWPADEWRLTRTDPVYSSGVSELIAAGAPYFDSVEMATALLLGVPYTGHSNTSREFMFRQQDRRGRFVSITVDAAEIAVHVMGERLAGASVELAAPTPGPSVALDGSADQRIVLPLPNGLPDSPAVVLRYGDEWLDRRSLGWPTRGERPGVEYVVAPENRLEALVSGGESASVEFKERLPAQNDKSRRNVMKTVAAFANGTGGALLFGVTNDGSISGLPDDEDRPDVADNLARLVQGWVHPIPQFSVDSFPVQGSDGRRVIGIHVEPGALPPYAAGTTPDNLTYYVRRSATTFAVMPDEVRAITLRPQTQSRTFEWPGGI